jgi:hypothetical protein
VWPWALCLLGGIAAVWPPLGLPAAFLCFVGVLSVPRASKEGAGLPRWLVGVASLGASVGVGRFLVGEAMPGIVKGGRQAVEQRAVSRLREILFAQDAMRRAAWIDPDADGIGSAARLPELCGAAPLRGQAPRPTPVLDCDELVSTPLGPGVRSGAYFYVVCLPTPAGAWSGQASAAVDEEKAERSFVAYAWPEPGAAFEHAFFIDQHENILAAPWPWPDPGAGGLPDSASPGLSCGSALGASGSVASGSWSVWRGKKPRPGLPGDTLSSAPGPREGEAGPNRSGP